MKPGAQIAAEIVAGAQYLGSTVLLTQGAGGNNSVKDFSSGIPSQSSAKKLENVANEAASHPLPSCADPKGLWVKAMHEVAKAAKQASKGGIEGAAGALPALENALNDLTKLQNEVKGKVDLSQV